MSNRMDKLFKDGEIWLPAGKKILDGRLVVHEGIIEAVGERSDIILPDDCKHQVYDQGEKLLPGFVEPHCHLGIYEEITGADRLNLKDILVAPDFKIIDQINFEDIGFKEAAFSGGVTTACILPGSAALIGGVGAIVKTTGPDRVVEFEHALKLSLGENVEKPFGHSASQLKERLWQEFASSTSKNISKSLKRELTVRAHCHRKEDIEIFLELAKCFALDLSLEHATEGGTLSGMISDIGVSLVAGPFFVGRPKKEMAGLNRFLLAEMVAEDILVSFMSDYPSNPPDMLRYALLDAIKYGVDEGKALDLITVNSARILGLENRVGSLETGKEADIVVHSHSPFEPKDMILEVYIKGELCRW